MIKITNLWAGYPGKKVLEGVDATIPRGALTVLLGPNGCGKSTLLKAICGLLPLSQGRVDMDGDCLNALSPGQKAKRMAYLAQCRQIPDITAENLVLHGRFPYLSYPRKYREQDRLIAREAMVQMGIADLASQPLKQLSGGQRQKVYIAMALAQQTPVILLDEPATYLDIAQQLQLMQQLRLLAAQGKTVVMISHDIPHALEMADHVLLMEQGRLTEQGSPQQVYASGGLDRVFGIRVCRFQAEHGIRYYCEEA